MARKLRPPTDYVTCQHCHRDFGAVTVLHLRNIHGYEGDHPIRDYKRKFGLSYAMCPESRKHIRTAKKQYWTKRGQGWSRARIIQEIKRRRRTGQSLRCKQVPNSLYLAASRSFGTWQRAVEQAGFNYELVSGTRHWNRTKIIEYIQRLAAMKTPLNRTYIKEHYYYLYRAAIKRFPSSWGKALHAAGFDPDEHRISNEVWNHEVAAAWVRKQVARKKSLLAYHMPGGLLGFVYTRLKMTWPAFLESLGVPYPGVKKCYDWTKRKLVAEMRRWQAEGHRMNYRAVADEHQALIHQARKFYGSWDRARAAARV
jgi:hypothetical protein